MTPEVVTTALGGVTTAITPMIPVVFTFAIGLFAIMVAPKKIFGFIKSMTAKA